MARKPIRWTAEEIAEERVRTAAPKLLEALENAQEVIHGTFCRRGDVGGNKECWKECREAREAKAEA
jgi:hypothetical protein